MGALRIVLGVIGGYVAMAVPIGIWAFAITPLIWPEMAPVDGEYPKVPLDHPGFLWELPLNFVAGLLGGIACGLIAGKGRKVSATVLVALMFLFSIPALFYTDIKPLWATIAAPILGGLAVFAVVIPMDRRKQMS